MIIFYQGLFGDSISEEYQIYANMVFEKINPWGKVIQEDYITYTKDKQINAINNTLGLRIKFIREGYCKKCEEIKINKKINKIMKKYG